MPKKHTPPYSRIRSRGAVPRVVTVSERTVPPVAAPFTSYNNTTIGSGVWEAMTDVVTPGFEAVSASGNVVFSPMERVERAQTAVGAGYKLIAVNNLNGQVQNTVYDASGPWLAHIYLRSEGFIPTSPDDVPPFYSAMKEIPEIARARAIAATQSARLPSDSQLLVALAEWKKTRDLLPGILNGWRSVFARINAREASFSRKRVASRPQDAARNLRDVGDALLQTYLAMRFGLRPLIMDTLGVVKALRRRRSDDVTRQTQRGLSGFSQTSQVERLAAFGVIQAPLLIQHECVTAFRAMTLWEARIDTLDDMGVNLSHVPEAAVDLLRFSFLLNWVININDFASALGAAAHPGWAKLGGCIVESREARTLVTPNGTQWSSNPSVAFQRQITGHFLTTTRLKRRVPGIPGTSLSLRPDPLAWTRDFRLLDAIALLRGETRGKGVRLLATLRK